MTTKHSIERIYERTNCNKRSAARIIENAIERGIEICELPGRERRFLEKRASKKPGTEYVVYNGNIFILTPEKVCVTTYPAPTWFSRKTVYNGKTRIRKPRKAFSYSLLETSEYYYRIC